LRLESQDEKIAQLCRDQAKWCRQTAAHNQVPEERRLLLRESAILEQMAAEILRKTETLALEVAFAKRSCREKPNAAARRPR
jgi:hypothetical protein